MAQKLSRGKKTLFTLLLVLLLLLTTEALAWLAFYALEGRAFSPAELAARRRNAAQEAGPVPTLEPENSRVPGLIASEVIHPFLGFVYNPELNDERKERRRRRNRLTITDLGFFREGPPPRRTGQEYRIGIFGGSVAFLFSFHGRDRLVEELAASPALAGREVVVDSFALGGYKQPQQLSTLAYLLALGERFDAVVNLDGFNELTLSINENLSRGVFPFYPRSWSLRVRNQVEPRLVQMAGEVSYLRRRRAAVARSFSRPVLGSSPTWNLLWRARDQALVGRISELDQEMAGYRPPDEGYVAHGPPFDYDGEEELYRRLAGLWRESSLQMHRLASANGIHYHHLLQPNQYLPGSKPMGREERVRAYEEDHHHRPIVEAGYPYFIAEGEALRRQGVSYHDLTGIFRDHPEPLYIDPCCHFNAEGNAIIASYLARVMRRDLEGASTGP